MIENIRINNYALIDEVDLQLDNGFSVITGETGAGKSILLGAIGLTIGQRADVSAILDKSRKCIIEIEYDVTGYHLEDWFQENDLDYTDHVLVRREVTAEGKSRCFINDTPVSNKLLKDFGGFMIDIHSQHQSLLLGQPEYQTEILDAFAGNSKLLEQYRKLYSSRRKWLTELKELKKKAADAEKECDYLKFQWSQLENARLQEGEKEELEVELNLLTNAENIKSALSGVTFNIRDMDNAAIQILKIARTAVDGIGKILREAPEYYQRLDSVIIELNDLADETERKAENIEFNARRIEEINQRLNIIYDLLYKYKIDSVAELIRLREELKEKLRGMEGETDAIDRLEKKLQQADQEIKELAGNIHNIRISAEGKLCQEMKHLLIDLGIRHADFRVEIGCSADYTPTGTDIVKFLFSANKNQKPGEIAKVASGGEISRVMLALKYVLSGTKQLPVIIFDEIDTGLSGEVAHRMAQMMREMAARMQVISISHLPQIAAAGNGHYKVYKEDCPEMTISRIKRLSVDERIQEIAGMISGKEITAAAVETAKNLLGK